MQLLLNETIIPWQVEEPGNTGIRKSGNTWTKPSINPVKTNPDQEQGKHKGLNTQGINVKQDTLGNNQGLNQEGKLQTDNTTKAGNRKALNREKAY